MNSDLYSMEELIPVVADLTRKYTSNESSSVSYETANQLMKAVRYCIRHLSNMDNEMMDTTSKLPAKKAYELGYKKVIEKVYRVKERYGEFIPTFCSFDNLNYEETVRKGIGGFFTYYDAKFDPMNTILTLDYPTLIPVTECSGIDAIERYLDYIILEQEFLNHLPKDYIKQVLNAYDADYKQQFYNIASVVLRFILAGAFVGKGVAIIDEIDLIKLQKMWKTQSKNQLEEQFYKILNKLVKQYFDGNQELYLYLKNDLKEFTVEIENATQFSGIEHLFFIV